MNYYAHTVSKYHNFMFTDLENLEDVLKSGYILSRRKLGLSEKDALFNGMDYISLCDLAKEHEESSAYNIYTKNGLSILLSKDLEVIVPQYILINNRSIDKADEMHKLGKKGRFSDLLDEVQVKDMISLDYMEGVSIPLSKIQSMHSEGYINVYIDCIYNMLEVYQRNTAIYNLDTGKKLKKLHKKY